MWTGCCESPLSARHIRGGLSHHHRAETWGAVFRKETIFADAGGKSPYECTVLIENVFFEISGIGIPSLTRRGHLQFLKNVFDMIRVSTNCPASVSKFRN